MKDLLLLIAAVAAAGTTIPAGLNSQWLRTDASGRPLDLTRHCPACCSHGTLSEQGSDEFRCTHCGHAWRVPRYPELVW